MNEPANHLNAGISNIIVIILVSVASIGMVTSYIVAGQGVAIREKIKPQDDEAEQLKNRKETINAMLNVLYPYIMEECDAKKIRKLLEEKIMVYNLAPTLEGREELNGAELTLEALIDFLARQANVTAIGKQLADYGKNTAEQRSGKLHETNKAFEDIKKDESDTLRQVTNKLAEDEGIKGDVYKKHTSELSQKILRVTQQKNQKESNINKQMDDLKRDVDRIKQQIEFLTSRTNINRDIVEVQGKIINPAINDWYAFINLGSNDRVKLGLKFRVYRRDKNGSIRWKGSVEVKKIFETYSQVAITQVINPSEDPIVADDNITNIFFSRGKPKFVTLVGEISSADFRYNKTELEQRLTAMGVNVEPAVSLRTDFVILGKNAETADPKSLDAKNYNSLRLFSLPYLEATDAREFIEYCLGD